MATHQTLPPLPMGERGDCDYAPIRIVLADDRTARRRGLRLVLHAHEDFDLVAEAEELPMALERLGRRAPDALVLELEGQDRDALELVRLVRRTLSDTAIVLLMLDVGGAFAAQAVAMGATAIVLKNRAEFDLADAVRAAAHNTPYFSPPLAAALRAREHEDTDPLSRREAEVLRLIALGYTNVEIADELRLSRRTIESHRSHIQRRLGLLTRAELVRYALDRRLIG
jgi:two-component system, NarL family, response regulator NreC